MTIPADEDSVYRAAQNDLYRNISARTLDADTLLPIFSDDFLTPNGLPSNTTYFNKLAEFTFNIDSLKSLYNSNGIPIPLDLNNLNPQQFLNGTLPGVNGLDFQQFLNGSTPGANQFLAPLGDLNILNDLNGLNSFNTLNPFFNYLDTVKQSLLNCDLPPLPGANLLPSLQSFDNLINIDIFDSILKKISSLPKLGVPTSTNIVNAIITIVESTLSQVIGPLAGYLKIISACIKKF